MHFSAGHPPVVMALGAEAWLKVLQEVRRQAARVAAAAHVQLPDVVWPLFNFTFSYLTASRCVPAVRHDQLQCSEKDCHKCSPDLGSEAQPPMSNTACYHRCGYPHQLPPQSPGHCATGHVDHASVWR